MKRLPCRVTLTGMMLTLFMLSALMAQAQSIVFNTVYIRADGAVDPPTAPIQRNGNVYNLTADIQFNDTDGGLVVERDNIVLDGGGNALELYNNPDDGVGIVVSQRKNVTIMKISAKTVFLDGSSNCSIFDCSILLGYASGWSVYVSSSNNNSILRNIVHTMMLDHSSNNHVAWNAMTGGALSSSGYGVTFSISDSSSNNIFQNSISLYNGNLNPSSPPPGPLFNLSSSSENILYHNTLLFPYWWYNAYSPESPIVVVQAENSTNAWDNGYPSGGNCWEGLQFTDLHRGPYQNESGSDGIGDMPNIFAPNNRDNYPLIAPVTVAFEDIEITNVRPQRTLIPAGTLAPFNVTVNNYGGYAAAWNLTLNIEYAYAPAERDFSLQADSARGWNHIMPGPTISVIQGDTVTLSIQTTDDLHHQFYVDYNNNSLQDDDEPLSPSFINTNITFSFTASVVGNFTYYDLYHQDTMFGFFSVNPLPTQSAQIGSDKVNLESNQNATLTFVWNTTGFMYGEYIISAYAKPALRETHITDNILAGGLVNMTLPGDLDGDYQVMPLDVAILANAYGSKPGEAEWNPNADINGNNFVGLTDLVTLAKHYGQPYPWPLGPPPTPFPPPPGP